MVTPRKCLFLFVKKLTRDQGASESVLCLCLNPSSSVLLTILIKNLYFRRVARCPLLTNSVTIWWLKLQYRQQNYIHVLQYYFGDINLPRDKFLQDELKLDDGCKFNISINNFWMAFGRPEFRYVPGQVNPCDLQP